MLGEANGCALQLATAAACSSMNAAALLLLAATAVKAIPQAAVDRPQVLASFESDKARAHAISARAPRVPVTQLPGCPHNPRLPCAVCVCVCVQTVLDGRRSMIP